MGVGAAANKKLCKLCCASAITINREPRKIQSSSNTRNVTALSFPQQNGNTREHTKEDIMLDTLGHIGAKFRTNDTVPPSSKLFVTSCSNL